MFLYVAGWWGTHKSWLCTWWWIYSKDSFCWYVCYIYIYIYIYIHIYIHIYIYIWLTAYDLCNSINCFCGMNTKFFQLSVFSSQQTCDSVTTLLPQSSFTRPYMVFFFFCCAFHVSQSSDCMALYILVLLTVSLHGNCWLQLEFFLASSAMHAWSMRGVFFKLPWCQTLKTSLPWFLRSSTCLIK